MYKQNGLPSHWSTFFQLQSLQRMQAQAAVTGAQSPPSPQNSSPPPQVQQQQQQPFGLANHPNSFAFSQLQMQQMTPLMQMQMGLPFVNPQAMQSLMRNSSPVPNQGFAGGVPGFPS